MTPSDAASIARTITSRMSAIEAPDASISRARCSPSATTCARLDSVMSRQVPSKAVGLPWASTWTSPTVSSVRIEPSGRTISSR